MLTSTLVADIYVVEFNEMFAQQALGTVKSDNVTYTVDCNGIAIAIYFSPSDATVTEVIDKVQEPNEHTSGPFGAAIVVKMGATLGDDGAIVSWNHDVWSYPHTARPRPFDNA